VPLPKKQFPGQKDGGIFVVTGRSDSGHLLLFGIQGTDLLQDHQGFAGGTFRGFCYLLQNLLGDFEALLIDHPTKEFLDSFLF
jgi:hypothetical protein